MSHPADFPVALSEVSKSFRVDGRVMPVLQDVSLYARKREFVTLIGPSGCGKSTLLNIICGLMEPDEGEILLHGERGGPRLGRVAYMPQRDLLLPWRRLMDNLILGPEVLGRDLDQARRGARELLALFGLEGFEDHYPATLSGGMRQRAALMRTFLCRQELVLLDEPLGALDALTRRTLRSWLLEVWARFEQTILFVTHDVEEAIFLSDRVYVLSPRPGRIVRELRVELPRPRSDGVTLGPLFATYREELLRALGI
jgi:ABC-type nitrate/sulfonate/bicarbonate transport system ATPase subunit